MRKTFVKPKRADEAADLKSFDVHFYPPVSTLATSNQTFGLLLSLSIVVVVVKVFLPDSIFVEVESEGQRGEAATMRRLLVLLILCVSAIHLVQKGEAIWLSVPSSGTKCVSEEIQNNVVVLADYVVVPEDHSHSHAPNISVKVTSPYGNNLYHQENVTHGQFAFTTNEGGNYLACFWIEGENQGKGDVSINLDWRTGIAAKDWESVARKEKIEGVELELRKLEGAVEAIHENLLYLKTREAEMRAVSEKTNARVAWYSIMSLGICIAASALQLWYLKRFFHKKKLI